MAAIELEFIAGKLATSLDSKIEDIEKGYLPRAW